MATREEFLGQLWANVINAPMNGSWIEASIGSVDADAPFADLGPALKRLLSLGASKHDLNLIARHRSYEAVFQVLYMLDDPGVDDDDNKMMHEELLGADPSGLEGRPGND